MDGNVCKMQLHDSRADLLSPEFGLDLDPAAIILTEEETKNYENILWQDTEDDAAPSNEETRTNISRFVQSGQHGLEKSDRIVREADSTREIDETTIINNFVSPRSSSYSKIVVTETDTIKNIKRNNSMVDSNSTPTTTEAMEIEKPKKETDNNSTTLSQSDEPPNVSTTTSVAATADDEAPENEENVVEVNPEQVGLIVSTAREKDEEETDQDVTVEKTPSSVVLHIWEDNTWHVARFSRKRKSFTFYLGKGEPAAKKNKLAATTKELQTTASTSGNEKNKNKPKKPHTKKNKSQTGYISVWIQYIQKSSEESDLDDDSYSIVRFLKGVTIVKGYTLLCRREVPLIYLAAINKDCFKHVIRKSKENIVYVENTFRLLNSTADTISNDIKICENVIDVIISNVENYVSSLVSV